MTQKRAPVFHRGSRWRLFRLILCADPILTELQIQFAASASLLAPPLLGRLSEIQPSNATSVTRRGWSISKRLSKGSMRSENSPNEQRQDDSAWLDFSMTTVALAGSGRVTGKPEVAPKWGSQLATTRNPRSTRANRWVARSPETNTNDRASSESFIRHMLPDHEPPFQPYGG